MTVSSIPSLVDPPLTPENVPLRSGPPTREELLVYYPSKFTWQQLKTFVNAGDLGLLKRDKKLQIRYETWGAGVRAEYGSMVNYLLTHRLQWGKPDALSLLRSVLDGPAASVISNISTDGPRRPGELPPIPDNAPSYFTADTPPELISIIMNDWPYSVPPEIEHTLIWTRLPIMPPDLPPSVSKRLLQDGLWGFTGSLEPPPSPSALPACLPALAEWGTTLESLVCSPRGTEEEEALVRDTGKEVATFVKRRWVEREWETAWFVNPPRLQSVPGLAHAHVFARHKSPEEISRWVD
ncbi:hypothetical protein B0H21DRAFT_689339 [Amylocystis lapponica]|nr:hypothetical protein B0H21DRAFT_689339 [Amylocystis lapponica]